MVPLTPSTEYAKVPLLALLNVSVAEPTWRISTWAGSKGAVNGGPPVAKSGPVYTFELVQEPEGITYHVRVPSDSYVYQTPKITCEGCWTRFRPQPDSLGFHQRSV